MQVINICQPLRKSFRRVIISGGLQEKTLWESHYWGIKQAFRTNLNFDFGNGMIKCLGYIKDNFPSNLGKSRMELGRCKRKNF